MEFKGGKLHQMISD
jgi:magnesium-transporting ATPase (P-type)